MAVTAVSSPAGLITWRYVGYSLVALAVMFAAIEIDNLWLLNFVHVSTSLLWTGMDLFMGFVLGRSCGGWRFRSAARSWGG